MPEISNQIMQENVLKDTFSWEVPVDNVPLPSKGKIYNPNSKLYNKETIAIKAMTAREEDILSSKSLIQEGKAIDELIKSCVVDKSIDIDELITGDKNALMIAIRITGYGAEYGVNSTCVNCETLNELKVDLSGLPINSLEIKPDQDGVNQFKFTLPVSKKVVTFKFLNSKDVTEIEKIEKFQSKSFNTKISNSITNFLFASIIAIDNVTDKNKIKHFINSMPAYDSKSLRSYIEKHEPGIEMRHEFNCKNCGHHNKSNLPMTINFFWPSF